MLPGPASPPLAAIDKNEARKPDSPPVSPLSPAYSTPPGSPPTSFFPFASSLSRNSSASSAASHTSARRPPPTPLVLEPKSVSWSDGHPADVDPHADANRTARDHHENGGPRTAIPPSLRLPKDASAGMPAGNWVADQQRRARSPLAPPLQHDPATPTNLRESQATNQTVASPLSSLPSSPLSIPSAPLVSRSPSAASPCFVHSHLDNSLNEFVAKKDALAAATRKKKSGSAKGKEAAARASLGDPSVEDDSDTASGGGTVSDHDDVEGDEDEGPSLSRQLAETASGVREMSKQLGRARVVSHIQSVMIITKARDNHLISKTRELALWLMKTPRNGRDRGLVVYVDTQLRTSKRFDAEGMKAEHPELFRPLPRRYSRTSSSVSLSSAVPDPNASKRMTPLGQINEALKRAASPDFVKKATLPAEDEGQLRYWTNSMASEKPQLFDFVVTLGGDGTVLYASWLFQHVVPPVIPFALGSLGFLTCFDFAKYSNVLNNAIDNGIRVNLRMRFTCTVYRAIEGEENKKRRAVRSGKTGGIFMKSLNKDGWEAIESEGSERRESTGKRDKEIKCFSTRPVESFEVLNDLVVDRGPSPYVSLLELFGDEHHMTTVQADGLTVSTPTGSTAYSLSAGGSLVHPEVPALLITPICPHTLSFRPMLLPDSMELRICVPYNSRSTAWASFDGRGRVELRQGDHIRVVASQYPFPTVCAENQSTDWFQAIARTLKWNERQRQKSFVILEEGRKKPKATPAGDAAPKDPSPVPTPNPATSAQEKAMVNFGDEEDDESDEEEEGDFETLEDETFDIDDLSSAGNPTTASSPNVVPTDPVVNGQIPNLNYSNPSAESVRQSSNSSSVELQDSNEDRFRDPAPRPPKLSSRHSHNDASEVYDRTPLSAPPNFSSHRMASSASRRRDRGEDGDRDHIHEPLNSKWNVAGSIRKSMSRERGQLPTLAKLRAREGDGETSEGRAFAVVGADSDTSVSDCEADLDDPDDEGGY